MYFKLGEFKTGPKNQITDVEGVKVGHTTLDDGDIQTGVTAIIPASGNLFKDKLIASSYVINGFGKTSGLVQLDELGTLESPIILTNTLSVGTAQSALVKYILEENSDIGEETGTINVVVGECSDAYLNDIRGQHVKEEHIYNALITASIDFNEGSVGAGRGMVCHQLKGGIGSSSRLFEINNTTYTLGCLVLANFGLAKDLVINGELVGPEIDEQIKEKQKEEKGSIMIILATDCPMSSRQLNRLSKRASFGIAQTGAYASNGSGDVVIAFSTTNRVKHEPEEALESFTFVSDYAISPSFQAVKEAVADAIYSALDNAETVSGKHGRTVYSLNEFGEFFS